MTFNVSPDVRHTRSAAAFTPQSPLLTLHPGSGHTLPTATWNKHRRLNHPCRSDVTLMTFIYRHRRGNQRRYQRHQPPGQKDTKNTLDSESSADDNNDEQENTAHKSKRRTASSGATSNNACPRLCTQRASVPRNTTRRRHEQSESTIIYPRQKLKPGCRSFVRSLLRVMNPSCYTCLLNIC